MRIARHVFDDSSDEKIELVIQRNNFADDVGLAEVFDCR